MPSSYASSFDDLLADNEKQMKDVMGGASNVFSMRLKNPLREKRSPYSTKNGTSSAPAETTTISGTANGVSFKLTV